MSRASYTVLPSFRTLWMDIILKIRTISILLVWVDLCLWGGLWNCKILCILCLREWIRSQMFGPSYKIYFLCSITLRSDMIVDTRKILNFSHSFCPKKKLFCTLLVWVGFCLWGGMWNWKVIISLGLEVQDGSCYAPLVPKTDRHLKSRFIYVLKASKCRK